jgi:hypothetical protein
MMGILECVGTKPPWSVLSPVQIYERNTRKSSAAASVLAKIPTNTCPEGGWQRVGENNYELDW